MRHTVDDILRASAASVWVPRGSEHIDDQVQLVRFPARFGGGMRASMVHSDGAAAAVLDHAIARTRAWGGVG